MNTKSIVITAAITSIVVSGIIFLLGGLVGNQSAEFLGGAIGITRYPNSGMAARGLYIGTSLPTSITDGNITLAGTTTVSAALSNTAYLSTLGCLKIYQSGATTVASTTYYLVASSTAQTTVQGGFYAFVTSTKPTYCN